MSKVAKFKFTENELRDIREALRLSVHQEMKDCANRPSRCELEAILDIVDLEEKISEAYERLTNLNG